MTRIDDGVMLKACGSVSAGGLGGAARYTRGREYEFYRWPELGLSRAGRLSRLARRHRRHRALRRPREHRLHQRSGRAAQPPCGRAGDTITIPFVPLSESAFAATVTALAADEEQVPDAFTTQLQAWSVDERGLAVFTVPFLGFSDQMMSMQVAAIADQRAGTTAPAA